MRTEWWMRAKDTSNLSSVQKQNRSKVLGLLHNYWRKEEFPINTTHKEKIPQIKDQKGTTCALAYILNNSGESSLIESIAQTNNYVLVNNVPEDHRLFDVITTNGISKKEAAKIQPTYSCSAIFNPIRTGEPIIELLGIIFSIAGLATALSFYWGINHVSYNFEKRTIRVVIFLGIILMSGGIGMTYQNSMAEPFGGTTYSGVYNTINIANGISIHYWIEGGEDTSRNGGVNYFKITPTGDGQITIAYPPIITKGYENYYKDNYYEHTTVLLNGEEIEPTTYKQNGYHVIRVNFSESDSSIEIINGNGFCRGFIFEEKPVP